MYKLCELAFKDFNTFISTFDKFICEDRKIDKLTTHYINFKMCDKNTMKSVIINVATKLSDTLCNVDINKLTFGNNINFDDIHMSKTVVFINLSIDDISYDSIASIFISQLYDYFRCELKGNLNHTIRFVLDEFFKIRESNIS